MLHEIILITNKWIINFSWGLRFMKFFCLPTGHLARVNLSEHTVGQLGQIVSPLYLNSGKTYKWVFLLSKIQ